MAVDINALLAGRNPYGSVGGDVATGLAQARASGSRNVNPFAQRAGYGLRDNGMDENPTVDFMNYTNPDKWNSAGLIQRAKPNGGVTAYSQIGSLAGKNPDDILKMVKDPSLIEYDEEGGLITPIDNMIEQKDTLTDIMSGIIGVAATAGTGAGIGNAFFGTPDLTTLLGGGFTSGGAGAGSGMGGGGGAGGTAAGSGAASAAGGAGGGGTGGLFGNAAAGVRGGGSFLSQLASSLGISPEVMGGLNTARQGLGIANTIGRLIDGGGGGGRPGGGGGGMDIGSLIANAIGGYQTNRNIQNYEGQINEMLDRGDPFRTQRPAYIERLSQLYADPSSIENTPGYKFSLEQGTENLRRKMAASGMGMSGNEMGEIQKFGQGLAQQTFNKERDALMQMAGANFNPATMAGLGISAFGNIANAQANRDAQVGRLFGQGSQGGSNPVSGVFDLFRQLFPDTPSGDVEDIFDYFGDGMDFGPGTPDWDNWDLMGG